jgi:hypothetical protein
MEPDPGGDANGQTMFARIAVMRALKRNVGRVFIRAIRSPGEQCERHTSVRVRSPHQGCGCCGDW